LEIITGYFISKERAVEAAEHLQNHGFKGEISIIGQETKEDVRGTENNSSNLDDIPRISNFGVAGVYAVSLGTNASLIGGSGPVFAAGPIIGMTSRTIGGEQSGSLNRWGVPKKVEEEIKSVVESGNIVVLINCEENEKHFVMATLLDKGAQNIHI